MCMAEVEAEVHFEEVVVVEAEAVLTKWIKVERTLSLIMCCCNH